MHTFRKLPKTYALPESLSHDDVPEKIQNAFPTALEPVQKKQQHYFDTFDWRLFNKGLTLVKERQTYSLRAIQSGERIASSTVRGKQPLKFWWDCADGPLRDQLRASLDVRALLQLASTESHITTVRVLNRDDKTVARIRLRTIFVIENRSRKKLAEMVELHPVRGYDAEFDRIDRSLAELGLVPQQENILRRVIATNGRIPGEYSSKFRIALDAGMSGHDATKKILSRLLWVMKQNEAGLKADIDSEFLHDFRVSIRRTRSALSLIKNVFPKDQTKRAKKEFATLGKLTNHLRDLDVYLLEKTRYINMLPEALQPGLASIFEKLAKERVQEQRKVAKALDQAFYKNLVTWWEEFLHTDRVDGAAKNANRPVLSLAKEFISKKYNQIIDAGKKITETTPDPVLHALRIECKKLRYLLEFFASLFPENEVQFLIKQLKKLQDNLGEFNDLFVQQESLKAILDGFDNSGKEQAQRAAAVGGLIAVLHGKQRQVRTQFAETFGHFSSRQNSQLFHQLFMEKQ